MDLCLKNRLHLLTHAALVHQEFLGVVPMLVLSATTLCQFLESKLQKFEFKINTEKWCLLFRILPSCLCSWILTRNACQVLPDLEKNNLLSNTPIGSKIIEPSVFATELQVTILKAFFCHPRNTFLWNLQKMNL